MPANFISLLVKERINNSKHLMRITGMSIISYWIVNYIYELIRKGYLPAIKLGSLKVLKTTLERFLIQNEGKDLSDLNNIRKVVIQVEVENE